MKRKENPNCVKIKTLVELCIGVICNNSQYLEDVGDVPDSLLTRILEACLPEQLIKLEKTAAASNRKLRTEKIWERHCKNKLKLLDSDYNNHKKKSWKR